MPRKSAAAVAAEFEERIRSLLKRCGFSDVGGGHELRLGEQIDACGGFEDTLLIVECKTGPKRGKPLLDTIKLLRGKMRSITEAAKTDSTYGKFRDYRFAVASNFKIREVDREEARKDPQVFLWDIGFVEYYEDLTRKIGKYAKYNLLGELAVDPRVAQVIQVPSFRTTVGSSTLYLFFANPKEILRWAYVARREIGREKYYQRFVQPGRLRSIAQYVNQGKYFPNAVILAFNVKPEFTPFPEVHAGFPSWSSNLEFGCLSFPATYRSCWIIDGQHRLYGLSQSTASDFMMPMVSLEDASVEDQAQLFLDINKNQKTVPADLVWDLEGQMRPNGKEGVISRVVKWMNREGPLAGAIYIPLEGPRKRGQLRLSGLCSAIKKRRITAAVLQHNMIANPFFDEEPDRIVKNVSRALNLSLEIAGQLFQDWQKNGFWFKNTGMVVLIALFERILGHCRRAPKADDYRKYLGPVSGHMERYRGADRLKSLRQRCNSEGGRDEVAAEFIRAIRKQTGDDIAPDLPEFEFEARIKVVERGLANLVAKALSLTASNWFKQRVSPSIQQEVKKRRRKDRTAGGAIQDFMTLGEVAQIVKRNDNWRDLKGFFVIKGGFNNLSEAEMGFSTVNRLRGRLKHGRAGLEDAEETLLDGYLMKFETVVREGARRSS